MHIHIQNYRGISEAKIEIEPKKITLVAGKNYSGKTSIAQAIAAVLTQTPIPIQGITKANAPRLVHSGSFNGQIDIIAEDKSAASVIWPESKFVAKGGFKRISKIAAGMESVLLMDKNERTKFLTELIGSAPTKQDLENEFKKLGIENLLEKVWTNIQGCDWDSSYNHAKEVGAKLKGGWETITGDNYGSQKALNWVPKSWEPDLEGAKTEALQKEVTENRKIVESAISQTAVIEHDLEKFTLEAAKISEYETKEKEITTKLELHKKMVDGVAENLKKLPPPDKTGPSQLCPSCKTSLMVGSDGVIIKAPTMLTKEAKEGIRVQRTQLSAQLDNIAKKVLEVETEFTKNQRALILAREAKAQLAMAKPQSTNTTDIESSRSKLARAESRLQAHEAKTKAESVAMSIAQNHSLCEVLSPAGLRKVKLATMLCKLQNGITAICNAAKWGNVSITPEMEITYNGMPIILCSASETFIAGITLQISTALMNKDEIVIIDGADILDSRGRNGLFTVLNAHKMGALVCMTINAKENMPDLSKIGGKGYWVENESC